MAPRLSRVAAAALLITLTLVVGGTPVLAWSSVHTSGKIGAYKIVDQLVIDPNTGYPTVFKPGVWCNHVMSSGTLKLISMVIRAPQRVYGAYPSQSTVRWRYRTFFNGNLYATSSWQSTKASTTKKASFTNRTWSAPGGSWGSGMDFTVKVDIQWFTPGGVLDGRVRGSYDAYKITNQNVAPNFDDGCIKIW